MSKFKKVSSDGKSSTFKHADGHTMIVAHNALTPEMAKAIKAIPAEDQTAADAGEQSSQKMKDGGKVDNESMGVTYTKDYSDGGSEVEDHKPGGEVMHTLYTTGGTDSIKGTPANKMGNEPMASGGKVGDQCPHCHQAMAMADAGLVGSDGQPIDLDANSSSADSTPTPQTSPDASPPPPGGIAYNLGKDVAQGVQGGVGAFKTVGAPLIKGIANTVGDAYHGLVGDNADGSDPTTPPTPAAPSAVAQVAQSNGDQPTAQAAGQAAQSQDPMGYGGLQSGLQKGFAEQKAGVASEAAAEGAQGKQTAAALDANAKLQQDQQKGYQDHFDELSSEYKNFMQDIQNQHIDPNHYWASKSTAAKVSTGLGLILGGIGAGLTGQSNAALEFLQKNIERDVESQKANLGKSESLLNANMKQFGNLKDATDMTRIMQQGIVANQLQSIAAQNTDPVAKARAQEALGVIDQHQAVEMQQFAQRRYMMQMMSSPNDQGAVPGDNSQKVSALRMLGNEPMAKDLEERSVPGVGTAKVPVPTEARNKMVAGQDFDNKMSELIDFAKTHGAASKLTDPGLVKEMQTKALNAQSAYREATGMGVLKMGEMPLLDKELPGDPTELFNSVRVIPRYEGVRDSARGTINTLKSSYGLPVHSNSSAASSQPPSQPETGVSKSGRPMIKVNNQWMYK